MKKLNLIVITGLVGYFIWDAYKARYDRVYRQAAGESTYENTHKKYGRGHL